jgi:non-specific serine/threonine protein kinase
VDLSHLFDFTLLPKAVTTAQRVSEEPSRALTEALIDYLKGRQMLLILDNCEHVINACAQLANRLLYACPDLRMIATSREALRVPEEEIFDVPPLSICDSGKLLSNDDVIHYEALRLFVERAVAVQPSFTISAQNAQDLCELCRRLDGMPLAIELAAARIGVFSLKDINEHLQERFRLLRSRSRTTLLRQQTLRATVDWSYDLLSNSERVLLRRLSVFRGKWSLKAAEDVCAGEDIQEPDVMELLGQLVEKSLVPSEERARSRSYRLLETVLKYAEEKLQQSGEVETIRKRHCDWALNLAEHARGKLEGPEQALWLDELELRIEDLRSALEWAMQNDRRAVLRLAAALNRFWYNRSHFSEGTQWLKKILAIPDTLDSQRLRVKVLYGATGFVGICEDDTSARSFGEESLSINRELDDQHGIAKSLINLAMVLRRQAEYGLARNYVTEALQAFRQLDDTTNIAYSLNELGLIALNERRSDDALPFLTDGLKTARLCGNTRLVAVLLNNLGDTYLGFGNDSLAEACYRDSLTTFSELSDKAGIAEVLISLARLAVIRKQSPHAVHLYAAAQTLCSALGIRLSSKLFNEYNDEISKLHTELSDDDFNRIWTKGCAMPPEQAVAYALENLNKPAVKGSKA